MRGDVRRETSVLHRGRLQLTLMIRMFPVLSLTLLNSRGPRRDVYRRQPFARCGAGRNWQVLRRGHDLLPAGSVVWTTHNHAGNGISGLAGRTR